MITIKMIGAHLFEIAEPLLHCQHGYPLNLVKVAISVYNRYKIRKKDVQYTLF